LTAASHPDAAIRVRQIVALTRESVRASVERAGDAHWRALVQHHEDQYPASPPTPGEVCRAEAERLNALGLGDSPDLALAESRVARIGVEVEITHVFLFRPSSVRLLMEPHRNYGP
jgi:hypothetical protein